MHKTWKFDQYLSVATISAILWTPEGEGGYKYGMGHSYTVDSIVIFNEAGTIMYYEPTYLLQKKVFSLVSI